MDSLLARTEIKTQDRPEATVRTVSSPCWTAQATTAGHQGHCGRCKSQSRCSHEASGQACCQNAQAVRSPERADTPHEICSRGNADKQTIAFNGARFGGLHEYHHISGYFVFCTGSEMRTIFTQNAAQLRAPRAALSFLPLKQKGKIRYVQYILKGAMC